MSYGTVQAEKMTTESGYSLGAGNASSFKNRIINGGMTISQRGTSFSYSNSTSYSLDRWNVRCGSNGGAPNTATVTQSSTAPAGFTNSLLYTVGTARTVVSGDRNGIEQPIEGYNVADLAWGTASAKPITLSFWVRSSLTGTFGLCFSNFSRGYAATYTIDAANTWEYKTVSIVGDTSGTWNTTTSTGFFISFDLGMGSDVRTTTGSWQTGTFLGATGATNLVATAGATFYLTGVQIEVGTVATSFDFRSIGTELALCQRYCCVLTTGGTVAGPYGGLYSSTAGRVWYKHPVTMRANPTLSNTSGTGTASMIAVNSAANCTLANFYSLPEISSWDLTSLSSSSSLGLPLAYVGPGLLTAEL